jgi:hypothetical protein
MGTGTGEVRTRRILHLYLRRAAYSRSHASPSAASIPLAFCSGPTNPNFVIDFDTILKGTSLDLTVSEMKQVDQRIWLVFATGWHRPSNARDGKRKAKSVNIFVCKTDEEKAEVVAFRNTRARPTDQASAE